MKYAFFSIRISCFLPDILKFIYFHFLGRVIVIVEKVNAQIILKFMRASIVLSISQYKAFEIPYYIDIDKQNYKYFGLNERTDN